MTALEYEHEGSAGGTGREEVEDDRLQRDDDRAEGDQQEQEGQEENEESLHEGDPAAIDRVAEPGRERLTTLLRPSVPGAAEIARSTGRPVAANALRSRTAGRLRSQAGQY